MNPTMPLAKIKADAFHNIKLQKKTEFMVYSKWANGNICKLGDVMILIGSTSVYFYNTSHVKAGHIVLT